MAAGTEIAQEKFESVGDPTSRLARRTVAAQDRSKQIRDHPSQDAVIHSISVLLQASCPGLRSPNAQNNTFSRQALEVAGRGNPGGETPADTDN